MPRSSGALGVCRKEKSWDEMHPAVLSIFWPRFSLSDRVILTTAIPKPNSVFLLFGRPVRGSVLVVSHAEEDDTIRIISARPATRRELKFYEEN
jgi:hypothetical protein